MLTNVILCVLATIVFMQSLKLKKLSSELGEIKEKFKL